jgi:hypothetical protein
VGPPYGTLRGVRQDGPRSQRRWILTRGDDGRRLLLHLLWRHAAGKRAPADVQPHNGLRAHTALRTAQVNKLAVHHLPLPGFVTACQFLSCAALVYGAKLGGCLHMDDFVWDKAKYFLIYVFFFAIGTYANMKVLSTANVETVIGGYRAAPTLGLAPLTERTPAHSIPLSS